MTPYSIIVLFILCTLGNFAGRLLRDVTEWLFLRYRARRAMLAAGQQQIDRANALLKIGFTEGQRSGTFGTRVLCKGDLVVVLDAFGTFSFGL